MAYLVAAAALYAIVFDVVPRFVLRDGVGLMNIGTRNHIIFSFFAAPGLLHYWVDGHIWKVRSIPIFGLICVSKTTLAAAGPTARP